MVCIQYKDKEYLKEECIDGRQLGFTGKQAIHPTQIPIIQQTYGPTPEGESYVLPNVKGLTTSDSNIQKFFELRRFSKA